MSGHAAAQGSLAPQAPGQSPIRDRQLDRDSARYLHENPQILNVPRKHAANRQRIVRA
jgi:hypothetical protein